VTQDQPGRWPQIDTSTASIARIYDYWPGGKDNFKADREAAELMIQQYPDIVTGVRKNRARLASQAATTLVRRPHRHGCRVHVVPAQRRPT
jgi:hypothetical protein